jgi:signal transduction histidine kinase
MSDNTSGTVFPFSRDVVRRFTLIFVPLMAVSGGVVVALYWNQLRVDSALLVVNQRGHVDLFSEIIEDNFRSTVSDLMFLANGQALASLLGGARPDARNKVAEEFQLFVQQKGIYDQVRFLNERGREVVRVNWRGGEAMVVSESQLQDKQDRYYFRAAFELERGQVFISPFDLNVEGNKIEQPLKPTIRFATPVFDPAATKRGIVVLNYLGAVLLNKLKSASTTSAGRMMLLDAEGYWLVGERPEEEWGFMFPEREKLQFGARFPDVWKRVASEKEGAVSTRQGIFVFRTIYPTRQLHGMDVNTSAEDGQSLKPSSPAKYYWKVVSHMDTQALDARSAFLASPLGRASGGLVVVLAVVSWLLARTAAAHHRARQRLLESERLAAIGEAMAALAHESRNALQRSQAGLEMLAKRMKDRPEALELLSELQKAQHDLHELYEKVRSYAAPLQLHRRSTDLGQLVNETWAKLAVQRSGRTVHFTQESSAANLLCSVDPAAIGQVFRNVFENALAAAPEQAEIQVRFAVDHDQGAPALRIAIRDNGPGLSPEQRKHIFDQFYTTKIRGTGLGMAIAKRIVEAHGGSIAVGADAGPGAEIVIRLTRQPA